MNQNIHEFPSEDLQEALRSAGVGLWVWDVATGTLRWSETTFKLFEVSPNNFQGDFESFLRCVHPEDQEEVRTTITNALAEREQAFHLEHRILAPDGKVKGQREEAAWWWAMTAAPYV